MYTNIYDLTNFLLFSLSGMIVMAPILIAIGMRKIQTIVPCMEMITQTLGLLLIKPAVLVVAEVC